MDSDQQGEKGESRFREICADAGLICNKSDRDRTGWDFIVEFPFNSPSDRGSLDSRSTPLSCHLQVKTIKNGTTSIQLRLTSAERLVKELKPAFIYIFVLNAELHFESAYLIHIEDAVSETVLRRLRSETAKGGSRPNTKKISLSIEKFAKSISPTGAALKAALVSEIGSNVASYAAVKQKALQELGYNGTGRGFSVNMRAKSVEDIVDTFLGLRQDVTFEITEEYEERFGIKLPMPGGSTAPYNAAIAPVARDGCTVSFQASAMSPVISIEGELFTPAFPKIPADAYKVLVKTPFFSVQLSLKSIGFEGDVSGVGARSVSEWSSNWEFLKSIQTGGELTIACHKIHAPMRFTLPPQSLEIDEAMCFEAAELCTKIKELLAISGARSEPLVTLSDLERCRDYVAFLYAFYKCGEISPLVPPDVCATINLEEFLWVDCFFVGPGMLSFAANISFVREGAAVNPKCMKLLRVRYLELPDQEFATFERDVRKLTTATRIYGHRPISQGEGRSVVGFSEAI